MTNPVTFNILMAGAMGAVMLGSAAIASAQVPVRQNSNSKIDASGLLPRYNGTWRVIRSVASDCPVQFAQFAVTINNGVVRANGGNGSVSGTGQLKFPGQDNFFRGQLSASGTGSGTYSGRCTGSFTATRTKP